MRTMVLVELDTATSNQALSDGTMATLLGEVLGALKPESAYFYARGGRRAFSMVVDIPDPTFIPLTIEPFWLKMNAHVETIPCMTAEELQAGLARLG